METNPISNELQGVALDQEGTTNNSNTNENLPPIILDNDASLPQGQSIETPSSDAIMTEQTATIDVTEATVENEALPTTTTVTSAEAVETTTEAIKITTTEQSETPKTTDTTKPLFCTADEELHRFLTKLTNVKPTVPPSFTRRILHQQGVGYMDPLVPKLISTCGDKFMATILSQALICKDRRINGEIMKKKYERERKRINQRRLREEMELDRMKKKKEDILKEFVHDKKKVLSEESKLILKSFTEEKKKKGGKFTFDSKGEEGRFENVEVYVNDDVKQEEDYYYASTVQDGDILEEDYANINNLDMKKPYLEDESDDDDEDEEEYDQDDTLQLVDIYRPLQAWGFSLAGKMGLATKHEEKTDHYKNHIEQQEEDMSNEEDIEEEVDDDDDVHMDGEEKTPARKKVKISAGETPGPASVKRKRSVTPKSRVTSSPSAPGLKKPKLTSKSKPVSDGTTLAGKTVPSASK